jgi:hypothetical protein
MATKTVTFKPPKDLAVCADQLYATREQRLALERQAAELQAQETALREHIINTLPKSSTGIAGKVVRISVETKEVYTVKDWDAFRGYIRANASKNPGVWALMNKAANQAGLKDMAEHGKAIPGVEKLKVPFVSINKV